jgi:hypothetical protein
MKDARIMNEPEKVEALVVATAKAVKAIGKVLEERWQLGVAIKSVNIMSEALYALEGEKRPQRVYDICVDFDGVIHSYTSGWKGAVVIPDPPVEGAFAWLKEMTARGDFRINIYSSRSKERGAIEAMKVWFVEHGLPKEVLTPDTIECMYGKHAMITGHGVTPHVFLDASKHEQK